jgi:hypothetical protein
MSLFKGVLESWNRSKSGKKFAEMLWAKNMRIRVYLLGSKHISGVGDGNAFLIAALLRKGRLAMTQSGQDF